MKSRIPALCLALLCVDVWLLAVAAVGVRIGPGHPDVWLTPRRKAAMVRVAREALRREKDAGSNASSADSRKEIRALARREGLKVGGIAADPASESVLFSFLVSGRTIAEYRVSSNGEVEWERTW